MLLSKGLEVDRQLPVSCPRIPSRDLVLLRQSDQSVDCFPGALGCDSGGA